MTIASVRARHVTEKANLTSNQANQKKQLNDLWTRELRLVTEEKARRAPLLTNSHGYKWMSSADKRITKANFNNDYKVRISNIKERAKSAKATLSANHKSAKATLSAKHKSEIANFRTKKK
ncbi:MAG: hypothetical protein [Phormidium phage MIS-PhV1A]|uniref:hypothetical protein n=1 Tax=Phormidium phage MIS-PhV1A TaxID=1391455 RepID=UPI0003C933CD|nr:MAG: hypothetical protein AV945_gp26 [Phormidium phage MIS-PhV1A]AGZ61771.1 MAG: hypothetical protein [Phormidium phage MIS-PhV1A]